ncbi:integral membrane protein [Rutstroemia sp. NJR-2017a WRK4]|nr:integral membrane protein [Rutstroemia sp. NJR-2017a WRK4]
MPSTAGVERHIQYVQMHEPQKLVPALKIKYAIAVLYISSFTLPKLSILYLYLDVFSASRCTRLFTYLLIGVVVATWISETLTSLLQCIPVAAVWNKGIHGHCVDRIKIIPNIITNVAMMVLPLPTIWSLNMTRRINIAVTFTFLLGSVGLICTIVRIVLFGKVNALTDPTWASVKLQAFTITEVSMYFMAGILPTLRSFATASWLQIRSNIWTVLTGSRASASRESPWVSSNKTPPPRTTHYHSNEIIDGSSDEYNLVDYNSRSTHGGKVDSLHDVKDGITKTEQFMVTRQPA